MTPQEILEEARSRFVVLYHNDEERLKRLLRQALGKYQERAGIIREIWSEDPGFFCPPHFQAIAGACDARRKYMAWRIETGEDGQRFISLQANDRHVGPYCLYFFLNLREWPLNEPLPRGSDSLICDYLEALISVPNTRREREAYLQAGMNESAQMLSSEQELRQRINEIEAEMESVKAIIPPASMY